MFVRAQSYTANPDTLGNGVWVQTGLGAAPIVLSLAPGLSSSTGIVQLRFHYGGGIEYRNKTDNTTWTSWRPVWNSANDGAGSGLDADIFDGLDSTAFAKLTDFVSSKASNGYCRLPNGMIIQAGRYTQTANTLMTVTFPLAFPTMCMGVVPSGTGDLSNSAEANTAAIYSGSVTNTGFQSQHANDNNTTVYWIAFGY